jgi:hypothetical protein
MEIARSLPEILFQQGDVCLPIMILGLNPLKRKLKNERFNPSFLSFKYQQSTVNSQQSTVNSQQSTVNC